MNKIRSIIVTSYIIMTISMQRVCTGAPTCNKFIVPTPWVGQCTKDKDTPPPGYPCMHDPCAPGLEWVKGHLESCNDRKPYWFRGGKCECPDYEESGSRIYFWVSGVSKYGEKAFKSLNYCCPEPAIYQQFDGVSDAEPYTWTGMNLRDLGKVYCQYFEDFTKKQ